MDNDELRREHPDFGRRFHSDPIEDDVEEVQESPFGTPPRTAAIDPQYLKEHMDKHGPYLYHSTSPDNLQDISVKGLRPRREHGQSKFSNMYLEPRGTHVYLGSKNYLDYASNFYGPMLQVDLRKLDPNNISADEENLRTAGARIDGKFLADQGHDVDPTKHYYIPRTSFADYVPNHVRRSERLWETLGKNFGMNVTDPHDSTSQGAWAEAHPDLVDHPESTRASLESYGTITHRGRIPPDAIDINPEYYPYLIKFGRHHDLMDDYNAIGEGAFYPSYEHAPENLGFNPLNHDDPDAKRRGDNHWYDKYMSQKNSWSSILSFLSAWAKRNGVAYDNDLDLIEKYGKHIGADTHMVDHNIEETGGYEGSYLKPWSPPVPKVNPDQMTLFSNRSTRAVVDAVRSVLTKDLLKKEYRDHPHPMGGHCYAASEAVYHLLGGHHAGLKPMHVVHEGSPHWFIQGPGGEIIDPTHDQFETAIPYDSARGKGFLTREPSRRAQEIINRVTQNSIKESSLLVEATWNDVMQKAVRLVKDGSVNLMRNGAQNIVATVVGDHGTYQCEIAREDPNSMVITQWTCDCQWADFAWLRTRQWKKYEGRVCSHVLATFWQSLKTPLDPDEQEEEEPKPDQQQQQGFGQLPVNTPGDKNKPYGDIVRTPVQKTPKGTPQQAPMGFGIPGAFSSVIYPHLSHIDAIEIRTIVAAKSETMVALEHLVREGVVPIVKLLAAVEGEYRTGKAPKPNAQPTGYNHDGFPFYKWEELGYDEEAGYQVWPPQNGPEWRGQYGTIPLGSVGEVVDIEPLMNWVKAIFPTPASFGKLHPKQIETDYFDANDVKVLNYDFAMRQPIKNYKTPFIERKR